MILGGAWKRFIKLLPTQPRLVGVVIAVHPSNEYTVELTDGGVLRVRARESYSINNRVFVVDQKIDGIAPSLPSVTIDV